MENRAKNFLDDRTEEVATHSLQMAMATEDLSMCAFTREGLAKVLELYGEHIVNNPQSGNFIFATKAEMVHQLERWGDESTRPPHHFQAVISYLTGKLMRAIWDKDMEKYEHHLITIAAVAGTGHKWLMENCSMSKAWFMEVSSDQIIPGITQKNEDT